VIPFGLKITYDFSLCARPDLLATVRAGQFPLVSNPQENVNWVYGFGQKPQTVLPAPLFVVLLILLFPLAVYLPTHLLFAKIFRAAGS
jgi:hypothetical protein